METKQQRHQVFPRRWVGRRPPTTTTHDDFRSIIDDVITANPDVTYSDDDETGNSSDTLIHSRCNAEDHTRGNRSRSDTEKTFPNNHTRPNAEKTMSKNLAARGAEIPFKAPTFRVFSYNILTDNCIGQGQYHYCPAEIRYMETRHRRIMTEILSVDPDVVCLQEVDEDHFRKRLKPEMEANGYSGVNQSTSDGQGLAIFWRSSMFELMKQRSRLLTDAIVSHIKPSTSCKDASKRSAIESWSRRPESTIIVHLRHIATGKDIGVCNNHIGWMGLHFPTLQALQVAVAFRELVDFVDPVTSSLVFCGDLNSPPSFPAYRLLSKGSLSRKTFEKFSHEYSHVDDVDRQNFSVITDAIPDIFQLPIHLESAYVSVLGREPIVTNCDGAHADGIVRSFCLDYIWYRKLEPVRVLETPSVAVVTEEVALPNTSFPSDHISIAAEFLLV